MCDWMGISSVVAGLTVAAWAASFPALWSSVVVSRQGLGDVSVCNALGSNTFDNLIGLGLPWLTYISLHGGTPYDSMEGQAVVSALLGLQAAMVMSYIIVAAGGWALRLW